MSAPRRLRRPGLAIALVLAACPASAGAVAATPAAPEGGAGTPDNGGARTGEPTIGDEEPRRERRRRSARARPGRGAPVLTRLAISRPRLFLYGAPVRVTFEIAARARSLRARLDLLSSSGRGAALRLPLGEVATNRPHTVRVSGHEAGELPEGGYAVRIRARDARGRSLKRAPETSNSDELSVLAHRFPLVTRSPDYGSEGARFGAGRPGHSHQGQDILAPEGTPVVAPRGGIVTHVDHQPDGAGHYVVVDGEGEERDYAFMHLVAGSVLVREGQRVRTGQRLGSVGTTGAASGAHLHFEIWEGGGWFAGGRPVDPLPYLRAWEGSA